MNIFNPAICFFSCRIPKNPFFKVVTFAVQVQVLILIFSSVLYLILPYDLVPDIVFPIGLIDDFIIFVFVLIFLSNVYRGLIQRRHQPRRVLTRTPQQAPDSHISPVHHRKYRERNHSLLRSNRDSISFFNPWRPICATQSKKAHHIL